MEIDAVVQSLGGWLLILSPDYEVTEEACAKLAAAGISRDQYLAKRKLYSPDPRKRQAKLIARFLYSEWFRYLEQKRGRDLEMPHNSGKRWIDPPFQYDFWQANARHMEDFQLSKGDIEEEILSNPQEYKPLISRWERGGY